jgi:hypothetical protein
MPWERRKQASRRHPFGRSPRFGISFASNSHRSNPVGLSLTIGQRARSTNKVVLENELFAAIRREHDALCENLGHIHDVFIDVDPSAEEAKRLLDEFEETLVVHF